MKNASQVQQKLNRASEVQEYQQRRAALATKLAPASLTIIPGAEEQIRSRDTHFPFRQDSDFYYLTGFNEPNAILVLEKNEEAVGYRSYVFLRPSDPLQEQWEGRRLAIKCAPHDLGVDAAYALEDLEEQLLGLLKNKQNLYSSWEKELTIGQSRNFCELKSMLPRILNKLKAKARQGIKGPSNLLDLDPIIHELRLIKREQELENLRYAAKVSVKAHERVLRACKPGLNEADLEADFRDEAARQGCKRMAYEPIVGAGENTCILHYGENDQTLRDGDLVLMDAGAEANYYAADITRTFPVNGRFSEAQRSIYNLVLKAQRAGIAAVRPGVLWTKLQDVIVQIITEGLYDLGLLAWESQQLQLSTEHFSRQELIQILIEKGAYKRFYMHNSGHWLGLDVHDVGSYRTEKGGPRPLEAGMVLTVEPGIYIQAEMEGVEPRWWNIGVRIEDDILVTETGHENLTGALAVEIEAIEAMMKT